MHQEGLPFILFNQQFLKVSLMIIGSIAVSMALVPIGIWLAKKWDIIDYPNRTSHTIHSKPTPRSGGIAIYVCVWVMFLVFQLWNYPQIIRIILAGSVIFLFGIRDDQKGMEAVVKLFGQLIAVTILIGFKIRVQFLENPAFAGFIPEYLAIGLDYLITYGWMVGVTNAFNLIDSRDGLAIGISEIISAFFFFAAIVSNQVYLEYILAIIFGVSLGVGYFNKMPAKIFLGDSGSQLLGFLLAAIAIEYHPLDASQASTWFIPILIFGVPIFDTTLVSISRLRKGVPIYKANLDHTFHRISAFGLKEDKAIASIHLAAILSGLIGLVCMYFPPLIANVFFGLWVLIFIGLLFLFERNFDR